MEEYTLDKQTTSGESSTAENNGAEHVETSRQEPDQSVTDTEQSLNHSSPSHAESSDKKEEDMYVSPVETAVDNETADTPILTASTSSPNTTFSKEPKIRISRLSNTDIDVWTNTVHKYCNFVPFHVETDTKPEISKV